MTTATPDPAPVRPRHRVRRWAGIVLAVGLLGGIASELFLRAQYGLGNPPVIVSDPAMEYRYAESGRYERRGNTIAFNAYSMRSADFEKEKSVPSERRVIVLGDSVINGGAQTDQSQLATFILEDRLRQAFGTAAVVGNVSAGSWGPQNLLAYVDRFGLFQADVVVVVLSSHDATDEMGPLPAQQQVISPKYLLAWQEVAARVAGSSASANGPAVSAGRAEPCLTALDALLQRIRNEGATPIVLFHFERSELDSPAEPSGHALLREVCKRHGIEPILLRSAFLASITAGRDPYRDHIHLNAVGQQVLADVLTPVVEAALKASPTTSATSPATSPTTGP